MNDPEVTMPRPPTARCSLLAARCSLPLPAAPAPAHCPCPCSLPLPLSLTRPVQHCRLFHRPSPARKTHIATASSRPAFPIGYGYVRGSLSVPWSSSQP